MSVFRPSATTLSRTYSVNSLRTLEDVAPGEDVVEHHRDGEGRRTGDEVGHAQSVQHGEQAKVSTEGETADDEEAPELQEDGAQLLLEGVQEAFPPGRSCVEGSTCDDEPPPKPDSPSEGPKLRRSPMTTRGLLTMRPLMLRMYSPRIPMKNS